MYKLWVDRRSMHSPDGPGNTNDWYVSEKENFFCSPVKIAQGMQQHPLLIFDSPRDAYQYVQERRKSEHHYPGLFHYFRLELA